MWPKYVAMKEGECPIPSQDGVLLHTHADKNENLKCWKILNRFPNMVMARSNNLGTNNFKEMTPISTTHPPTKLEIINREALHWWPRNPCQKRIGNLKMNINTLISTARPQVSNSWLSGQRWSLNNAGICSNLGPNRIGSCHLDVRKKVGLWAWGERLDIYQVTLQEW